MSVIELTGELGPLDALTLRRSLDQATAEDRPQVLIDMSAVKSLHPAVAAAIVRAARQARRSAGQLRVIEPKSPGADRMFRLISLPQIVR